MVLVVKATLLTSTDKTGCLRSSATAVYHQAIVMNKCARDINAT